MEHLSRNDLLNLIKSVFPNRESDRKLAFLVDFPPEKGADNPDWALRRSMAYNWFQELRDHASKANLEAISLIGYPSVGSNNADLPREVYRLDKVESMPPDQAALKAEAQCEALDGMFEEFQLFMAPTEFSTTAPLKNAAKTYGFRGATMPGFSPKMIPVLRLDFNEVSRRVKLIKERVDRAESAEIDFNVQGGPACHMYFDLRFRKGHLSSGQLADPGTAGNAPSGETYIVPYEGERPGIPSKTRGTLPVQVDGDVLFYQVEENRAIAVRGPEDSPALAREKEHLQREPAYGNMSELGFGVLGDFGLQPIGEILLDEKLGLHIAFGRSDHFGGQVGPGDFSAPSEVIHLDRIYIKGCQPDVQIERLTLTYEDGSQEDVIRDGQYLIF